ncbi:MAG: ATP-binding protein [Kofleriaceae bacterium]|nr:ATP-binding protein [Kofleriaceae bacterium]MBP9166382.1 ATP-binding protein [Kofleriaceae bacterium]MBP9858623.1 ATP-binding protein [Kofleriaceae bacterium]
MPTNFSFDDVTKASFSTGAAASELNKEFAGPRLALKGNNYAARLAIARSLAVAESPAAVDDAPGQNIKGHILFGDGVDLRTWVCLLVEHTPIDGPVGIEELQELVRRHWARGVRLLDKDWKDCGGDHDRFIMRLAEQANLRGKGAASARTRSANGVASREPFVPKAVPVRLPMGPVSTDLRTGKRLEFAINAKGNSPHVAIMGTLGTGKTFIARTMATEAHQQSGCPVLVFDMGKGDMAGNPSFVRSIGAEVLTPPQVPVPLDVLHLSSASEAAIAAMRFRESFDRIPTTQLGPIQKNLVGEATERALRGAHPVRLADIQDRLKEVYAENRRKDDMATTTFSDLAKFKLFEPKYSPTEFFSQSWVVDVHTLPDFVQRCVVFLILDAAYTYLSSLGDSAIDADGNRSLRLFLCVDEARKVLAYNQDSLIGLVRESRSKGGAVMTVSQSPDDFSNNDDDFLSNIGLGICLKTNAKPALVTRVLGQTFDLGGLRSGEAVTRLHDRGFVRFQAWDESSFETAPRT